MKKLFNVKREGIFSILAKHDLHLQHFGTLFVSAFMTQAQADAINAEFPDSVFLS